LHTVCEDNANIALCKWQAVAQGVRAGGSDCPTWLHPKKLTMAAAVMGVLACANLSSRDMKAGATRHPARHVAERGLGSAQMEPPRCSSCEVKVLNARSPEDRRWCRARGRRQGQAARSEGEHNSRCLAAPKDCDTAVNSQHSST
jgi:hypothetical protein